jgi:HSP20 family protein
MPAAEMDETEDEIQLKLEIPGMEAKDLDIEVSETSIEISGERKSERKTEAKGMVRSEFSYGKFERVIPLDLLQKYFVV